MPVEDEAPGFEAEGLALFPGVRGLCVPLAPPGVGLRRTSPAVVGLRHTSPAVVGLRCTSPAVVAPGRVCPARRSLAPQDENTFELLTRLLPFQSTFTFSVGK